MPSFQSKSPSPSQSVVLSLLRLPHVRCTHHCILSSAATILLKVLFIKSATHFSGWESQGFHAEDPIKIAATMCAGPCAALRFSGLFSVLVA